MHGCRCCLCYWVFECKLHLKCSFVHPLSHNDRFTQTISAFLWAYITLFSITIFVFVNQIMFSCLWRCITYHFARMWFMMWESERILKQPQKTLACWGFSHALKTLPMLTLIYNLSFPECLRRVHWTERISVWYSGSRSSQWYHEQTDERVVNTHSKRWARGDTLSGRLPRFVLAWQSGGHGRAKWGRRNTYSQFPQIRGRSSLGRSRRGERETPLWTKNLNNVFRILKERKVGTFFFW